MKYHDDSIKQAVIYIYYKCFPNIIILFLVIVLLMLLVAVQFSGIKGLEEDERKSVIFFIKRTNFSQKFVGNRIFKK